MKKILRVPGFFALILLISSCSGKTNILDFSGKESMPHLEKKGTATQLIVDGDPLLMLGGELHNSSMGGFEYMRPIWKKMSEANLNTVIATASWELVEPEEGKFEFSLVDSMIIGARKQNLKLVVIWFGSWKNGSSTYAPAWVKLDQVRFPLAKEQDGNAINTISTLSDEAANADAKAFAALMKHIRKIDGKEHTVVTIQVENEMGTLRTNRDYSEKANAAFSGPVPAALMDYLDKHRETIHPGVRSAWEKQGFLKTGTWEEVFGKGVLVDDWKGMSFLTEELFMAWNYASYVEKVAAAGKKEYNIPMYVNAWLKSPTQGAPGNYPCGGPSPQVLDAWRAGAPSINFIAPDIYIVDEFRYVCDQYTLSGNPLFIPETTGDAAGTARAFFTYGKYSAVCFAPFGIDGGDAGANVNDISDMKDTYGTLKQLIPFILEKQGTENIGGLLVDDNNRTDTLLIGGYKIRGNMGRRFDFAGAGMPGGQNQAQPQRRQAGGAIIISTGPGEFIVAGRNCSLNFSDPDPASGKKVSFLYLEDGKYFKDKWIVGRRLNGDEFRVSFPSDKSKIYRLGLYRY